MLTRMQRTKLGERLKQDYTAGSELEFARHLDATVQPKHIGEEEKDIFLTVADTGNAAAHCDFTPNNELLPSVVGATEHFLYRAFILPKTEANLRAVTPKRENLNLKSSGPVTSLLVNASY